MSKQLNLPDNSFPWEPWFDYDDDGLITEAGVDTAGRASNVCVTTCENVTIDDKELFNRYVRRDTLLIAAAPELLAALREALEAAELAGIHQHPDGGELPWYVAGCDACAKAEGRTDPCPVN